MIVLVSSSPSRASILENAGLSFVVRSFKFDESLQRDSLLPQIYVQQVLRKKVEQAKNAGLISELLDEFKGGYLVFADSCVGVGDEILTKANSEAEAIKMLSLQSGASASVFTAMSVISDKFDIFCLSKTTFKFDVYSDEKLDSYIKSKQWQGKAGAMMIEGFSGEFVLSQEGSLENAMGLDVDILKAFL